MSTTTSAPPIRNALAASVAGACVGTLGGLIGLGGAEFRLPLLIGLFGFIALEAVVLNKAISLIVVASSLLFRSHAVSFGEVLSHYSIALTLLAGSVLGSWFGADLATRMDSRTLHRVIAALLACIALVLMTAHDASMQTPPLFTGAAQTLAGIGAGFVIGVVASFLGVAGGELLIPTLVLLFGLDIKLAGSLSLAVSLPTMLVGFARYRRDRSFSVVTRYRAFALAMAVGSVIGAFIGGRLLGIVPAGALIPVLAAILVISAFKVWRHQ